MRLLRLLLLWFAASGAPAVLAAEWLRVPGAPDVEIDLASAELHRSAVTAWVRIVGQPAFVAALGAPLPQKPPKAYRTAWRIEIDCERRTLRTLAVSAYDGAGTPLFMSGVPGPVRPLPADADAGWTYDAVCEWSRGRG